ncbi:DUF3048 domain-containing protein [Pseudactinotalea sp. HY158]|uniref:DUF3048 domain-containing protein n=1 Tax=Pseudactinotalea sp. HY158 TaxID=2654547 RepID=UPI00129CC0EE|nr:DUF3048 domain-containing protein [Pseudactinotalea sp. HY158]QGH70490.1 DUF3048 domain-containing protein [Pseudactinotalea sp. HY158]
MRRFRHLAPARLGSVGVLGLAAVLLVGCAPKPAPTEWVTVAPTVSADKTVPPDPAQQVRWPLTGEPAPDAGDDLERAAVSVKIENSAASRPQVGLQRADIVWEELVEGGMTRFVATYHSDLPEDVGPIRSIRPMDAAIAGPVGGVLAYSGGQLAYQQKARAAGLVLVSDDGGGSGFYRNPQRRGDHTLFGDPRTFLARAGDAAPPPAQFAYADSAAESSAATDGREASAVATTFPASSPSWQWGDGGWRRYESGSPATDGGDQITAANVVVLTVTIRDTGNRDAAGAPVPETILTGTGEAIVLSDGHAIDGTWSKGDATDVIELTDAGGEVIELTPGNTWVELVPVMRGTIAVS